ncbi:MAG: phosphoribosylformylglycinamidine cyclo-ligase [Candidatus Andersenbacteria bacterium RIFCSPHIGHO2_12_FULL_46_9]|nr:MAG: Phosphoribosylformylglycinamidine cyclo-ligase [Parcubacteria group bacterium GW2011_GWA2_45_14]OGY34284.1 MAG: phosphoribosylformylglycinamidine cyclo-ligase [Candidatus Andersenbacteria bacterium RIFCSPHIGHO2_02_FULL_46_16]OGY36635.1 MAG: phosphoribosylformylglycinamidine cyclo-ligase [Candidatus Andersenbacteria bacterium RIFCSPLOWO2_02_FULL_46_11]OGY38069.1 MAG: phosphoribosylformylglycinamidine cyclo-ligase [Candidatus Andersenbacteria bacterium RIFCSPHIGHO2_12_FULL_46_9]OGY40470.1
MSHPMTYASTGVDYSLMDPFKRQAQEAAQKTAHYLREFDLSEVPWSRGESAYLIEMPDCYLAHVEEGLGTKNLVADAMYKLTGRSYYHYVARDTIAMIVNDMITLGALPISLAMHLAAGHGDWFKDEQRVRDLIYGWKEGCDLARCTWAGGETPTLKDMITPETVVLSGSAIGLIKPKEKLIVPRIQDGDAIVLLASSGIHANGLTMARRIADKLPQGYLTPLADGQTYGAALVQPTTIYVKVIEACLSHNVEMHYTVNITGHGWRKLMRVVEPFVYVIDNPGEPQALFGFVQEHGPVSDEEAYGNLNMGAGFAIYVRPDQAQTVIELAACHDVRAWVGGHIEKRGDDKRVIIVPKALEYAGAALGVR